MGAQACQPHVLFDAREAIGGMGAAYPGRKVDKGKLRLLVRKNRNESRVNWGWDDVRVVSN